MHRYRIDSMKYDKRLNENSGAVESDMSDWGKTYQTSRPSSRYGEDDGSSVTHSRPRRSRLDNDIAPPRGVAIAQPSRSRNAHKQMNGSMSNGGGSRTHSSTFNGYDIHNYQRAHNNSSRGPNDSFSGLYPPSRNVSGYASDYLNNRSGIGMLPNKIRDPRRPRSTAAEKYTNGQNGFGGYESGEISTSDEGRRRRGAEEESEDEDEDEEEEEMRNYYMAARRAQGSRSVTNHSTAEAFGGEDDKYYYGVVKLGSQMVDHVLRTMPPPDEYYMLKPIERVAYLFYCAVYSKPFPRSVAEFHKIFNREFYNYVCSGDTDDLALFKICKSMQNHHAQQQLEASRKAYEKAQKEAAESEKLDFNQHRIEDPEDHEISIAQPEMVLSNGPLHYHQCLAMGTIGVGGKLVMVCPAGTVDASGHVRSTTSVPVDELKSLLLFDQQIAKVIESVQSFKGPLIAGQTPTHSVRLYIQRQIDSLRVVLKSEDVKKAEVIDALLIWQLLEIMVQQHGRVTGPDIATLLLNASEELKEQTGIAENGGAAESANKAEAKERFNKFLLGGHINEAVESAISDGLYADAMTLIRRLHPHDSKKIEEIETRFMQLRSIDDPFATLVSVASGQPPPILSSSSFDDGNNWKRHAAILLANLNSQAAMKTVYDLGLLLARRERHCAADFCLLVVCVLAGYDPFLPLGHAEGEEKARKHIELVHSGSHLLNRVDGLSGIAGFSFTDLHATDIFDYALRLGNNNVDSPLAKSTEYQLARIEYAKKISSYGGFATDAFRYCTEIARSIWMYISAFEKDALIDLCDLADRLHYVAAATPAETEWIGSLRMMMEGSSGPVASQEAQVPKQLSDENSLASEAQKWHDDHQAPIEISRRVQQEHAQENIPAALPIENNPHQQQVKQVPSVTHQTPVAPPNTSSSLQPPQSNVVTETTSGSTETSSSKTTVTTSFSNESTIPELVSAPKPKKFERAPPLAPPPPPTEKESPSEPPKPPSPVSFAPVTNPPPPPVPTLPTPPVSHPQPIQTATQVAADVAKSPRTELEDLWGSGPPPTFTNFAAPAQPEVPVASPPVVSAPPAPKPPVAQHPMTSRPSVPNTKTAPPPSSEKPDGLPANDRKTSKGWFGSIKEKVIKSIPSANQMILPDDKKPTIVWDPVKQKYVGAGVEEEVVAPPPPVMSAPLLSGGADSNKSSTNSLRNARSGVGSRYLQSGMTLSQATPAMNSGMPSMMPPTMMPLPATFGFMPAATDVSESSEYVDPFSGEANPSIPSEAGTQQDNAH